MSPCRPSVPGHALLALLTSLLVSCSGVSTTANREQATDRITGTAILAKTMLRATALAAVRHPVKTAELGLVVMWHRPTEIVRANLPFSFTATSAIAEVPGTPEFENLLDRNRFPRPELGAVKWLVDGGEFFTAFDRELAAARHSIDCQVYIFDNDDIAVRYADKLKARAADVRVRVLFDDFGSTGSYTSAPETPGPVGFQPPADMAAYLTDQSQVKVRRILNPWLVADHTKLLVFDRRTAFLGGMNIGREYYSEWHDLMVRVTGPIVGSLATEFDQTWKKAGPWGDLFFFRKPMNETPAAVGVGEIPLRVFRTDPANFRHEILDSTLLALRGARKRVWIENPYFAHDDIAMACEAAAKRGVDVRVILPASGDSAIMDSGNLATARRLIQAGATVFRYPRMTHMKVMICDGWASVGSANLDTLSMRINRELNVAFSDPAAIRGLEKAVFEPDFKRSRKITLAETEVVTAGLAELVADQL